MFKRLKNILMNGIINVLKPAGMTSHDVVGSIRKLLSIKRIGHTGTLDPMAVGVLPICINSATRMIEYLDADSKKYRCEMQLGIETDTQDIWGKVLNTTTVDVCNEDIIEAVAKFTGDILQTPPNYSAVRVNGRRLYDYARHGEAVEVKSRWIHINSIRIISMDLEKNRVLFDVESSKGTYIRTICTEVGRILGCGAAMRFLVRTASGSFTLEDALTFEEIGELHQSGLLETKLLSLDYPLGRFPSLGIKEDYRARSFIHGGPLDPNEVSCSTGEGTIDDMQPYKVYYRDKFIAMARYDCEIEKINSEKVFCQEI